MGEVKELAYVKKVVTETADAIIASVKSDMKYKVGTMIEIPRAAITADEIAKQADFFSFGTNDLTQMTFGFSRDDAGKFLDAYYDRKIYENDPFAKLDQKGVGRLIEMAAKLGRTANPDLHLGICGEHGGDPSSVEFCHRVGLDYVSCSPSVCPSPVWPPRRLPSKRADPKRSSVKKRPAHMSGALFSAQRRERAQGSALRTGRGSGWCTASGPASRTRERCGSFLMRPIPARAAMCWIC